MKNAQSLHLTVKQPPNPEPIKTLGVFANLDNPAIKDVIYHYLGTVEYEPKSDEFVGNVKDEVLKLLSSSTPIAVSKLSGNLTVVYFQNP